MQLGMLDDVVGFSPGHSRSSWPPYRPGPAAPSRARAAGRRSNKSRGKPARLSQIMSNWPMKIATPSTPSMALVCMRRRYCRRRKSRSRGSIPRVAAASRHGCARRSTRPTKPTGPAQRGCSTGSSSQIPNRQISSSLPPQPLLQHPAHLGQAQGRAMLGRVALGVPVAIAEVDQIAGRNLGHVMQRKVIVADRF